MSGSDPFPDLPFDPDLADTGPRTRAADRPARPTHLQPALVGLVLLGGAVGAPIRYLIGLRWATAAGGFPWSTFTINVGGAFVLGVLLESLARAGQDTGVRRTLRLLLGTGLLGAFTTYSTLAVEVDLLVRAHASRLAAAYAVGSLAAGLLASLAGILVAAGGHRARTSGSPAGRTPGAGPDPVEDSP